MFFFIFVSQKMWLLFQFFFHFEQYTQILQILRISVIFVLEPYFYSLLSLLVCV